VFPNEDANFHREFAFLEHEATIKFLRPILVSHFGTLESAKEPTLDWLLAGVGSLETYARSTRNGGLSSEPAKLTRRRSPDWYTEYCASSRFRDMKERAEASWREYMEALTCCMNARHEYQAMHHRDYGRLGEGDEFRFMIPLCHECHEHIRARGPGIPSVASEAVKQWL
jgi:hypothetical protein